MDNQLDLNLLRLFVSFAECQTITEAARRHGMTRSNASQRLKALEQTLGAQLIRRTTRHLELTQAGHVLYRHSLKVLSEVRTAVAVIDGLGDRVRGDIRIRVPTGFGHLHMSKLLLEFGRTYPDVTMRVLINDHIDDVVSAEVDVAIKITSSPPEDHVARKVCDIRWYLCAAPSLFEGVERPKTVDDLLQHDLLTPASFGPRFPLRLRHVDDTLSITVSPRLQSGDYPF